MLAKYGVVWQLLLRLRRARTAVDAAWHQLKARAGQRSAPSPSFARLLALRLSLAHLLTALLSHLQVLLMELGGGRHGQMLHPGLLGVCVCVCVCVLTWLA